jgi:hypothetical protein
MLAERVEMDKKKRMCCEQEGIDLIDIPYWWDYSISSLASTVSFVKWKERRTKRKSKTIVKIRERECKRVCT